MHDPLLFWIILFGGASIWLGLKLWQRFKRAQALQAPFPENWLTILKNRLPLYDNLPQVQQQELQNHIKPFLFDKTFVGCAGLEVTEEMRVTIAACACLLLLNRQTSGYKKVRWIYLYPSEFVVHHSVQDAAGVVTDGKRRLVGEAWHNGRVILSWDDVAKGVYDFNDGRNVVLHEFAHQLDGESGNTNGAPLLYSRGAYGSWATIMSREYNSLREHAYFGKKTILDTYGATNPAEFFAVATETFFEEPDALAEEHPELFEELKNYYQNDPREWHKPLKSSTLNKNAPSSKPSSAKSQ